ncbi:MAG: GntR family transcriptional regulator [Erysipelotrichaceae bacterium]|nr:GntR family transcriptional regulator [Erysipelotrichaceae bacterium]MDY5252742.1 GntR family transcriptional regulator [Erysipelotrichaceae bacterium]
MFQSKQPLYVSIMEIIKDRILTGVYPLHTNIPTETQLEEEFKVSKITIRKAITLLENEGFLSKRSGIGTKVINNGIYNILTRSQSFTKCLSDQGKILTRKTISIELLTLKENDPMYSTFNPTCYKIIRHYFLDGKPYIFYTHYLTSILSIDPNTCDDKFSIYMHMYNSNIKISSFVDEFYVDQNNKDAQLFFNSTNPFLGRKRTTYDNRDNVIEISFAQYDSSMQNYEIHFDI